MPDKRPYGKHEAYVEGDIIRSIPRGEITLSEVHLFNDIAMELIAKYGYCFYLADIKESTGIEASARRYSAQWSIGKPVLGIAMFNAGLIASTLFTLLLKAANIIRKQPLPFAFFRTEQEARAWLELLREQHLAKPRQGPPSPAQQSALLAAKP